MTLWEWCPRWFRAASLAGLALLAAAMLWLGIASRHQISVQTPSDLGREGDATAATAGTDDRGLALLHGVVFDARRPEPLRSAAVLIRGGKIEAVLPSSEVDLTSYGEVVDLQGRAVLPGLIDSHVHVLTRLPERDLASRLATGVTTVVDAATTLEHLARRDVDAVPRRLGSGPILTAPGGYPILHNPDASAIGLRGVAEAREAALEVLERGADFVKVAIEAGFTTDLGAPGAWPSSGREELEAIVEMASARGRVVRAHLTQPKELELALESGVEGTMHMPLDDLPEGLVTRAIEQGFTFVTTAAMWKEDAEVYAAVCRNVGRLAARGARLVVGTDTPNYYRDPGLGRELRRLVECGMSPSEALVAATRTAGEALPLPIGTLEPGQLADLVVVSGRPWERIEDLEDPWWVLVGGRPVAGARHLEIVERGDGR